MKRSELKQLIREVIQEIRNDTHAAGSLSDDDVDFLSDSEVDFDATVEVYTPDREVVRNVPVRVYAAQGPDILATIAKQDVSHNGQVVFNKSENIFDYVLMQSKDKLLDIAEKRLTYNLSPESDD